MEELDYEELGKRIKRIRGERKISQEKLAEMIDVSIPHMSNIENGKTKFSLQVFANLANALNTTPDMLLLGQMKSQDRTHCMVIEEIDRELSGCTMAQMTLIEEVVRNMKKVLVQYDRKMKRKDEDK